MKKGRITKVFVYDSDSDGDNDFSSQQYLTTGTGRISKKETIRGTTYSGPNAQTFYEHYTKQGKRVDILEQEVLENINQPTKAPLTPSASIYNSSQKNLFFSSPPNTGATDSIVINCLRQGVVMTASPGETTEQLIAKHKQLLTQQRDEDQVKFTV